VISKKKIIFDFGSNNGQNLDYFLKKAEFVVAVEANTVLTEQIKKNFSNYIDTNRLFIENIALAEKDGFQNFYINKENNLLSSLQYSRMIKNNYQKTTVKCTSPSNIINKYLNKLLIQDIEYIKIDLEGCDHIILDDLFKNNIFPNFISTEVHNPKIISLILNSPYKSFKFLEGSQIGKEIKIIKLINFKNEIEEIHFTEHASGPYGDDIPGKYFNKDSILPYFLNNGLGWKDICCSLKVAEYNEEIIYNQSVHISGFKDLLKKTLTAFKKALKTKIDSIIKKFYN
jgi:hypothetical protein